MLRPWRSSISNLRCHGHLKASASLTLRTKILWDRPCGFVEPIDCQTAVAHGMPMALVPSHWERHPCLCKIPFSLLPRNEKLDCLLKWQAGTKFRADPWVREAHLDWINQKGFLRLVQTYAMQSPWPGSQDLAFEQTPNVFGWKGWRLQNHLGSLQHVLQSWFNHIFLGSAEGLACSSSWQPHHVSSRSNKSFWIVVLAASTTSKQSLLQI